MARPFRYQRRRTKGWKKPPNAFMVTRPGKFGNPYETAEEFRQAMNGLDPPGTTDEHRKRIVWISQHLEQLTGRNLCCWCPLDKDCHADVLLEMANPRREPTRVGRMWIEHPDLGRTAHGAVFSPDRRHRYTLWRRWNFVDNERMVAFVGLNPSTADEFHNDNTVRRCIRFAQAWQYDGMIMLNAFAYRDTDPKKMKRFSHPIGDENDDAIDQVTDLVDRVIVCWGVHCRHMGRAASMRRLLIRKKAKTFCLDLTKHGEPKHPLFVKKTQEPFPFFN